MKRLGWKRLLKKIRKRKPQYNLGFFVYSAVGSSSTTGGTTART